MCTCVNTDTHTYHDTYGGQKTTSRGHCFSSTTWVLGIEFRLPGLTATAFIHWATLPLQPLSGFNWPLASSLEHRGTCSVRDCFDWLSIQEILFWELLWFVKEGTPTCPLLPRIVLVLVSVILPFRMLLCCLGKGSTKHCLFIELIVEVVLDGRNLEKISLASVCTSSYQNCH